MEMLYPTLISNNTGLSCDSRKVVQGNVFFALIGAKHNGADYIDAAIQKGAIEIIVGAHAGINIQTLKTANPNISFLAIENVRAALAYYAAQTYTPAPEFVAAVTGTNGKSSVVHFCREIWNGLGLHLGLQAASIGTLGVITPSGVTDFKLTTPDSLMLHQSLQKLAQQKIDHVAMEASSIGIDQHRLDYVPIRAAGFTNLTRDHLDYHHTMDEYRAAKLELFSRLLSAQGTAIVNADTPEFETICSLCADRDITCWGYGESAKEFKILKRCPAIAGQDITAEIFGKKYDFHLPLIGHFQLMNILCALGMVLSEQHIKIDDVLSTLTHISAVPGRLQKIPGTPDDRAVFVDYAHTPDGLETVLTNVLEHRLPQQNGRILCVFGCGGDRDKTKRPMMGEIASQLCDHVYITDDNPRSEAPAIIRAEIIAGCSRNNFTNCDNRRSAILSAVQNLQSGDILIIAGKGHERGQIFADHIDDFDDSEVTAQAIAEVFSP